MSQQSLAKSRGYSQAQIDVWRNKLAIGNAITSLNQAAQGKIECSTSRMKAIEIILRKTLPDLTSVDLTSNGEGVTFTWGVPSIEGKIIDMTAKQEPEEQTNQTASQDTSSDHLIAQQSESPAIQPLSTDTVNSQRDSDGKDDGASDADNNGPVDSPDDNPQ